MSSKRTVTIFIVISLSFLLAFWGGWYFGNKTASSSASTIDFDRYVGVIDSINVVDSLLYIRSIDLKRREDSLSARYDSLISINKSKYESNINNIDTLSTDELIRIFSSELSN